MEKVASGKKIMVSYHGHEWPVYPLKCRDYTIYRVIHRVNGERHPKTFGTLAKAKADALAILKEIYAKGDSKIHLTDDDKLDWKSATSVLRQARIRASLETVCRHYADLVSIVGSANLLTDMARKHAGSRGKTILPLRISSLRNAYVTALEKKQLSDRHIDAQRSHTGQFLAYVGEDAVSDGITREVLQGFIDSKKKVDPRTKKNLLDAVKTMMTFGKSSRNVPVEWEEANHVVMPAVKPKKVSTYTAEELKKLLAAAPEKFQSILALAAFAGIRSSELELLEWKHIRLLEQEERDRIINIDIDVTEESGKRTIPINETLRLWITGPFKLKGKFWSGSHDDFYRMQQQIAKAAGVEWKQNALRHTCISARVATIRDVGKVAYESGNSVSVIKRHYLDLMPPSVAQAWFAVTPAFVHKYRAAMQGQKARTQND